MPDFENHLYNIRSGNIIFFKSINKQMDWSKERQKININDKNYILVKILNLHNFKGIPQASIVLALDISKHVSSNNKKLQQLLLLCFLVLVISYFILNMGYRLLDHKIIMTTAKLEQVRERLNVTLRSIGDGVITVDLKGNIIFINKITEELTGWKQAQAKGKQFQTIYNTIYKTNQKPRDNLVEKILTTKQTINLEGQTLLISKEGTQHSIVDSGSPIFNKNSEIIGVVIVFRNMTKELKAEEELHKAKKLESVGVLAGGIAHDFNNILSAILGNIELAQLNVESESETQFLLEQSKKATIRARNLTKQLLTFSKGGSPIRKITAISNIITDSANFVLHGSPVNCEYNFPPGLWPAYIDSGQIGQVIQNFIINAKHAMPDGGKIKLLCENFDSFKKNSSSKLPLKQYIKITIMDTGCGIPKSYIDKIFDPYFTTKSTQKNKGSGLGLSICHSIISKHDGIIEVESKINVGTTFTIYLPASLKKEVINTNLDNSSKTENATILVMDDEVYILNMLKKMLEVNGHKVILAENGNKTIELYNESLNNYNPIDIIILDLTIPGSKGGKEIAKQLIEINPSINIIIASGYSNDPIMNDFREYGIKAAINKPFQIKELNEVINQVLEDYSCKTT